MLLCDAHPGYITWERLEQNERQLRHNARMHAAAERRGAPREAPPLLQGLAICGVCGRNMTVRYKTAKEQQNSYCLCSPERIEAVGAQYCQNISGGVIDRAVGALLVELMTPLTLDVASQA